ncbi:MULTISPECIES: hypothetical protein [Rhodococcus]|uniref:hypothetical protein n=1 Tax=Rhodococcus TaxID=1827 RepID=UPI0015F43A41|nr:hypothetical protein [Rhodococcus sp. UFZ-B548]
MTDKHNETDDTVSVGSRVHVTVRTTDNTTTKHPGVVIEDYADMAIDTAATGRDWAPVHRWAIALDDGRLIFANSEDLL